MTRLLRLVLLSRGCCLWRRCHGSPKELDLDTSYARCVPRYTFGKDSHPSQVYAHATFYELLKLNLAVRVYWSSHQELMQQLITMKTIKLDQHDLSNWHTRQQERCCIASCVPAEEQCFITYIRSDRCTKFISGHRHSLDGPIINYPSYETKFLIVVTSCSHTSSGATTSCLCAFQFDSKSHGD